MRLNRISNLGGIWEWREGAFLFPEEVVFWCFCNIDLYWIWCVCLFECFCNIDSDGIPFVFCCFDKINKAVGIEHGRNGKNCLFFLCFRFVILTRVGSDAVAMGKKLCRIFYRQRINFTFGEETKALQNAATILWPRNEMYQKQKRKQNKNTERCSRYPLT